MDTDFSERLSDSERGHQEDVHKALAYQQANPWCVVTPQILKMSRIRAWTHRYHPRYVQHLIKLVYGSE